MNAASSLLEYAWSRAVSAQLGVVEAGAGIVGSAETQEPRTMPGLFAALSGRSVRSASAAQAGTSQTEVGQRELAGSADE